MDLKQYQIVLVNLDPTVGSEIKKTRPCVIISPNEMNKYLNTVIVAPMTTQSNKYPTRIEIKHDNKNGWIVLDKIRTIDKQRIYKALDGLTVKDIEKVKLTINAKNGSYPPRENGHIRSLFYKLAMKIQN